MKLPIEFYDPNVIAVSKVYPFAFRCEDGSGYYIVSGVRQREEIGKGKTPEKAWQDAARRIEKDKKKGTQANTRLKSPRKKK
jgi:hypothetical protein